MALILCWLSSPAAVHGATAGGTVSSGLAQALLARVRANDSGNGAAASARRFLVDGTLLGHVLPQAAEVLSGFPGVFDVDHQAVRLREDPAWTSLDAEAKLGARTARVAEVLEALRAQRTVPMLTGWRDEPFAVRPSFYTPPTLVVERAAGPLFGLPAYGCFTNGFVCAAGADRPTHLWLGRRSRAKPTWPGLLDCVAAGGIAAGQSVSSAMARECLEEAGIPAEVSAQLRPAGGVSYTGFNDDGWGIKADVIFAFDLQLPASFRPVAVDGEMEDFMLMPVEQVRLRRDAWMPGGTCAREGCGGGSRASGPEQRWWDVGRELCRCARGAGYPRVRFHSPSSDRPSPSRPILFTRRRHRCAGGLPSRVVAGPALQAKRGRGAGRLPHPARLRRAGRGRVHRAARGAPFRRTARKRERAPLTACAVGIALAWRLGCSWGEELRGCSPVRRGMQA